jgi:hypothetical protein
MLSVWWGRKGERGTYTNDGSLSDSVVLDESRLDLSGREPVSRDVDDIVNTSSDPVCEQVSTSAKLVRDKGGDSQ